MKTQLLCMLPGLALSGIVGSGLTWEVIRALIFAAVVLACWGRMLWIACCKGEKQRNHAG